MTQGAVYVAYGEAARREACASIGSLMQTNPGLPVAVIADRSLGIGRHIQQSDGGPLARWAKLMVDQLSPFDSTLYLDADTRVCGDLSAGFRVLEDGWDLAIAPSRNQGRDLLSNVSATERRETLDELGCLDMLGLQGGLLFVRKAAVEALFATWRAEWKRYGSQDQGALLRALQWSPVRTWLLSWEWNSAQGSLVEHKFGRARG